MEVSKGRKSSKQQAIQYNDYRLDKKEWLIAAGKGMLLGAAIAHTFYRSAAALVVIVPAALIYPLYEKKRLQKKRLADLTREFQESTQVIAAALGAGYSIENAFTISTKELTLLLGEDGLMVKEMKRMETQIRNNISVEAVLLEFGQRSGVDDIQNFGQVFAAAKRSGGQLAEILRNTAEVLREKARIREEIQTLTAAKRFEQRIMNLFPFFIIWYMKLTSPGFLDCMYQTTLGRIVMSICLILYLTAFVAAEKILDFEF